MRPGSRTRRTGGARLPQLPWTQVANPYAPLEILSADQVEAIHQTSLRILEEIGIELMSPAARAAMRAVGAEVDEVTGTVKVDRAVVERALATTPARFTLTSRNPAKQLRIGDRDIAFGLVAGPPFVHDCERGRRAGNLADYRDSTEASIALADGVADPGDRPAAGIGARTTLPVTIVGVDAKTNEVRFYGPDKRVRTVELETPEAQAFAKKLKVGDEVIVTFTEALAVSIEPAR